jgi:hypothetical protein
MANEVAGKITHISVHCVCLMALDLEGVHYVSNK